jgi:aspartate/methionine/tyrosine aminotransferase
MTVRESAAYLSPHPGAVLNVMDGYPAGLNPEWITGRQMQPAAGYLDAPPATYIGGISGHFAEVFGTTSISLAPTCSLAFGLAVSAITTGPGDEFILTGESYNCWPLMVAERDAAVTYVPRSPGGQPDPDAIDAACTPRTRAVVIVSPDNPLGAVVSREVMKALIAVCLRRNLTLVADHSLAEASPGSPVPLVPRLARRHLSWIAVGGTSKVLGLAGSGFGVLACSPGWADRLADAASAYYFSYSQLDLQLLASVLTDARFGPYKRHLSDRILANRYFLGRIVQPPLRIAAAGGGPFTLVSTRALEVSGEDFAGQLERRGILVMPVSAVTAGQPSHDPDDPRFRVSLARPGRDIGRVAEALNETAAAVRARR